MADYCPLPVQNLRALPPDISNDMPEHAAELVIESTGRGTGLSAAFELCRPLGTIILKSTAALAEAVDLTPMVVNELNIIGSRCGRFDDAIQMVQSCPDMPQHRLISARYPLEEALDAFTHAERPTALKVLLEVTEERFGPAVMSTRAPPSVIPIAIMHSALAKPLTGRGEIVQRGPRVAVSGAICNGKVAKMRQLRLQQRLPRTLKNNTQDPG